MQPQEIYRQRFSYSNPVNKERLRQKAKYFGGGSTPLSEKIPLKFFEIFAAEWPDPKKDTGALACAASPIAPQAPA